MVPPSRKRSRLSFVKENLLPVTFGKRELVALEDISLDVAEGECVGIIGENGSGKSTLLKVIAGIMMPDSGSIRTRGKVSPFLELGVGFQGELTARENVFIFGSLLGIPKKDMNPLLPGILSFAGLAAFSELKVKNFSSGMYARLAFSCAVSVEPDILLIDEVFAVGDEAFRHKCMDRLLAIKRRGGTIVIVSHRLGDVKPLCDRLFLLSGGRIAARGDPEEVVSTYLNSYVSVTDEVRPGFGGTEPAKDPSESVSGHVEGTAEGYLHSVMPSTSRVRTGDSISFDIRMTAGKPVSEPNIIFQLYREGGPMVFGTNTLRDSVTLPDLAGGEIFRFTLSGIPLLAGNYHAKVELWGDKLARCLERKERCAHFSVMSRKKDGAGLVLIEHEWSLFP